MRDLWLLLRHRRDFRRLATANLISLTGGWMVAVGLAFFVYQLTGSTLASFLPSILLSSLAGVYVDRWNRKTTMITANLMMAASVLPLPLVRQPTDVWLIYVVTAAVGILKLFTTPAEQAMLVSDEELVNANALNGQTRDVARPLGSAIGGLVIATGGITSLALADAATFLAAAALVAGIKTDGCVAAPDAEAGTGLAALAREWSQCLHLAASRRELRAVFAFTFLAMTGEGIMGSLFAPFVKDVPGGTARAYGLIVSVQAIGGILGGLVAVSVGRRLSPVAMFGFGAIAFGLVDLVMFLYPLVWVEVWPAAVCMVVVGVPGAVAMMGYNTLLQRGAGDAFRGRCARCRPGHRCGHRDPGRGLPRRRGRDPADHALQGVFGVIGGLDVLGVLRRQLTH